MKIQKILQNKAGVTILEGVVALGILALVMAGSFGVLLSTSRQTTQPDMYEEMMLAVEKASELLKEYPAGISDTLEGKTKEHRYPAAFKECICPKMENGNWVCSDGNKKDLGCLLPPICDTANSSFRYDIASGDQCIYTWPAAPSGSTPSNTWEGRDNPQMSTRDLGEPGYGTPLSHCVKFEITCNGYQL